MSYYLSRSQVNERKYNKRIRLIYLLCALACFGSVAVAIFYFQNVLWLEPCPYCKLQRVIFILLGFVFTYLSIFNPKKIFATLGLFGLSIVTACGIFIAGKHVYIQNNPNSSEAGSCQATTNSIVEILDFEVIKNILTASGDCSVIEWNFLGLSLPMLSLIAYITLGFIGISTCLFNKRKYKKELRNRDRY